MWRRLACMLGVGSAVCWAGCGAGDPPARLTYTSIAQSRADAVAREVTLRAGDLPEFKATAHSIGWQDGHEAENSHEAVVKGGCRRSEPALRPWAGVRSQMLSAGNGYHALAAFSIVAVMPTAAAAGLVVSEERKADLSCIDREVRQEFTKNHHVRGIYVGRLPTSVSGSDESVAYQAVISWRDIPLVLYMDVTLFSYGQDVVALFTYHSSDPVPPAMETRLLSLLVARARAHSR